MSSSDQTGSANSLRSFTATQLRELLQGRLDGHNAGNLHRLVITLRNTQELPQTMGATGGATARMTSLAAVQEALVAQARTTEDCSVITEGQHPPPETDRPTITQLNVVRAILHRHEILHLAEQRSREAQEALRRFNIKEPDSLDGDKTFVAACARATSGVLLQRARLEAALEEASSQFPEISSLLSSIPILQSEAAAAQTATDIGASSPAAGPVEALIARYQNASAARFGVEPPADGRRRLDIAQNRALAAACECTTSPVSGQVRAALAAVNAQLNTQSTLPGSPQSRNNLMLHLHALMNRQLLTALPTNEGQLRDFFLTPHADSGLSNLSLVQMLAAV
ncbi:MAG: hypothetical protein ACRC9R_11595, partial [Enterovibrio sp.]